MKLANIKKTLTITKSINDASATMGSVQHNYFLQKLTDLRDEMFGTNVGQNLASIIEPTITVTTSAFNVVHSTSSTAALTLNEVPSTVSSTLSKTTSTAASTVNCVNNIALLKLPSKITPIGRPKGLGRTVIGLKRKSKSQPSKAVKRQSQIQSTNLVKKKFLDLTFMDQSITIVGWLTNMSADGIMRKKISSDDIIQDSNVFNRLRNDAIVLDGTKKYFDSACYRYIREEVEKLEGTHWACSKCKKNLSGDQIMCNSRLDWFHTECAGYEDSQSQIVNFCVDCCKKTSLIQL